MQIIRNLQTTASPLSLPTSLAALLPLPLVDAIGRCGAPVAEELRLHANRTATVTARGRNYSTHHSLSLQQMQEILGRMCGGSLYAYRESICHGYVALPDGIRVGVCGTAATEADRVIGVSEVTGLIIRIPHRVTVDSEPILSLLRNEKNGKGVLIYSPPGIGKTTLLRAVAESASRGVNGMRTVTVDTREELSYTLGGEGLMLDILTGYPKQIGIEIAVRSLGAELIVCDEIGNEEDVQAILHAANCGVPLVASAHAASVKDLLSRSGMRELHRAHVFGTYVGLCRTGTQLSYSVTPWEEA